MTVLLKVDGLTKRYFGLTAVDDVSYEVEASVRLIGQRIGQSTSIDHQRLQPATRVGGRWMASISPAWRRIAAPA